MTHVYIRDEGERRPHDPKTGLPRDLPGPGDLNVPLPVRNSNAATELDTHVHEDGSIRTAAGIIVAVDDAPPRAWVKLAGEPPQRLFESPMEFAERWREFQDGDAPYLICHDFSYGTPLFFLREATIAYIGVTYPTTEQQQIKSGSIYTRTCTCWKLGGPCPRPDA